MRMYLAGSQDMGMLKLLVKAGAPYVLMSHHYMMKKSAAAQREVLRHAQDNGCQVLMDAGTFTFNEKYAVLRSDIEMRSAHFKPEIVEEHRRLKRTGEYKTAIATARKEIMEFFDRYLVSISDTYADTCVAMAELDVDQFFDEEHLWRMRERYPQSLRERIIVTPHQFAYDQKHFQALVDHGFRYFGLDGMFTEKPATKWFSNNWDFLVKNKIHVHGWAGTKEDVVRKVPFYSIDSSVGPQSAVWVRDHKGYVRRLAIADLYQECISNAGEELNGYERRVDAGDLYTPTMLQGLGSSRVVWQKLRSVVRHDVAKRFVRVHLQGGRSLDVTADHSLFQMTSAGALQEITPAALRAGSWIVAPRAVPWSGKGITYLVGHVPIEVLQQDGRGSSWTKNYPGHCTFELSESFLELAGFWFGDGSFSGPTTIAFACGNDPESIARVQAWAASVGRVASVSQKGDVQVCHAVLVRALRELGFVGHADTKVFPQWFWNLSETQACAFLRGYFTADGSAGDRPYVASNSEAMIRQTAEAIASLTGHTPSVCQVKKQWRATISGNAAKRAFVDKIGFFLARKVVNLSASDRWQRDDELPASLALSPLRWGGGKGAVVSDWVSREVWGKHFDPRVASRDVQYLKVLRVEELGSDLRDVYDLEVPGAERFIANGVLAHNTTWLGGQRYGTTYVYEGNLRMRVIDFRQKGRIRPGLKMQCEEYGIDFQKFCADDADTVGQYNAHSWVKYSKDMALDTSKAYWMTEDDKKEVDAQAEEAFGTRATWEKVLARRAEGRPRPTSSMIKSFKAEIPRFCNTCVLSAKCPAFVRDDPCQLDFAVEVNSVEDIKTAAKNLVALQMGRVAQAAFAESVLGTHADRQTSLEVQTTARVLQMAKDVAGDNVRISFGASVEAPAPQAAGALSRLFGGYGKSGQGNPATTNVDRALANDKPPEAIDVTTFLVDDNAVDQSVKAMRTRASESEGFVREVRDDADDD